MVLWFEWIDYFCPHLHVWCTVDHINPCVDTIQICGNSKFFYVYFFVHQFHLWNYIPLFIIILLLLLCSFFSASFPRMYFNLCPPWSVFSFILLYYKEPFLYFFCRCVSCCCHLSWDIFSTSNQHWYRNRKNVGGNSLSYWFISFCFASVYVLCLALYTDTSNFLRWLCRFYCRCYNDYLNRDLRK